MLQEPLSSLLWGSGKSQDRFLVLDLLLGLQGMDGETQASCPNDHTLVSGQGCDHLRVVWRSYTVPSQTGEGQSDQGGCPWGRHNDYCSTWG